jgi:imidazolonepropionase-like amidohydrolase
MLDYARLMPTQRRRLLEAGITTIRELGNIVGTARAIAQGIATGALAGPHLQAVGPIFTAPMGIPVATDLGGNVWVIEHGTRQVDDADEARREVGRLADDGFAGVAVVSDSGIIDRLPRLDPRVLQAIVAEAHARGLWVAVVTGRVRDVREAVLAGADTIEHGPVYDGPLPADVIDLLRTRGVTYVPALAGGEAFLGWVARAERPEGFPAASWEALHSVVRERGPLGALAPSFESVRTAASAGVRIGAGAGGATELSAELDRELALLVAAGLTPAAALRAATRDAALALRAENELGTIAPGKLADLVLVAGRPWEHIEDVRAVRLVIQAGRVVVDRR